MGTVETEDVIVDTEEVIHKICISIINCQDLDRTDAYTKIVEKRDGIHTVIDTISVNVNRDFFTR